MPSVAIKGSAVDTGHDCDTTTELDTPGQGTVRIGGQLVARLGDKTVSHEIKSGDTCVPHTAAITESSSKVRVVGSLIARLGDACDAGSITFGNGASVNAN